jgi:hypothetical protein
MRTLTEPRHGIVVDSRKARWICIGSLRSDTPLCGVLGRYAGRGYWLNWRGRTDWCQPNEFSTMEAVARGVRTRLRMVRLEAVALASRPPHQEYQKLWVLVRRYRRLHN